jgi:hypothetical protein
MVESDIEEIANLVKGRKSQIYRDALLRIAYLPKKMTILELESSLDLAIRIAKEALDDGKKR